MAPEPQDGGRGGPDPLMEAMLEEAARDAARLRRQVGKVTIASGIVLAAGGAVIGVAAFVSYAQGVAAAAAAGTGAGGQLGVLGGAMLLALVLVGAGAWFVLKGSSQTKG